MSTTPRAWLLSLALAALAAAPLAAQPARAPDPPKPSLDNAQARGPADAPIVIVEFTDLSCEPCAAASVVLDGVFDAHPGKVRHLFRHAPGGGGKPDGEPPPEAILAHEAALAAGEQGRFWEMRALLFANQDRLTRADMSGMARQLELDVAKFDADLDSGRLAPVLEQDAAEAKRLGITRAPAFYVNGERLARTPTRAEWEARVRP
jgi:protein-disulfide isomerase